MKVVVHVKGGLGNQLIQYLFAYHLSGGGNQLVLDTTHYFFYKKRLFFLDKLPQLRVNFLEKAFILANMYLRIIVRRLYSRQEVQKSKWLLCNFIDDDTPALAAKLTFRYTYVDGYFQNRPICVPAKKDQLMACFDGMMPEINQSAYFKLIKSSTTPVMFHLRCGDYINNGTVAGMMGRCSPGYYDKALQTVTQGMSQYSLFIFSDDAQTAKEFFSNYPNACFIEGNVDNPVKDFLLMRLFEYAVIANSTLSYMACMLSTFEHNKVVLPSPWFENGEPFLLGAKKGWIHVAKS